MSVSSKRDYKLLTAKQQIPPEAAYLFDAVFLYARALNQTLRSKQNPRDGKAIFQHVKDKPYFSKMRNGFKCAELIR